jgi:hypothetical protein
MSTLDWMNEALPEPISNHTDKVQLTKLPFIPLPTGLYPNDISGT